MTKMIAQGTVRANLLRRWRAIEEEEEEQEREEDDSSASGSSRVHKLKEQWSGLFSFFSGFSFTGVALTQFMLNHLIALFDCLFVTAVCCVMFLFFSST